MSLSVSASYAKAPTATEDGILGVRIIGSNPVTKSIDIALVMDTSGSMEGERIASVKKTLSILVSKVDVGDKITLIGFSDKATLFLSSFLITNDSRAAALAVVEDLVADGGTNLEVGISMLGTIYPPGTARPDALVVLTDGHVNQGIKSLSGLCSLMNSYMSGIPVYTLGYGDNHNGDLLRGIADRTRAVYTYIDAEIVLPASIGDLMGALKTEVAKSVSLKFDKHLTCLEPNYSAEGEAATADTSGNAVPLGRHVAFAPDAMNEDTVPDSVPTHGISPIAAIVDRKSYGMGSIVANKPTWVVFSVPLTAAASTITLEYSVFGVPAVQTVSIAIDDTLDKIDIHEQMLRCTISRIMDSVSANLKAYSLAAARANIADGLTKIAASPAKDRPLAIRMKAQLDELATEVDGIERSRAGADIRHTILFATASGGGYSAQRGVTRMRSGSISSPFSNAQQRMTSIGYSQEGGDPDLVHDNI
jgi:hypothetical protein